MRETVEPGDLPAIAYNPAPEESPADVKAEEEEVAEVKRTAAQATGRTAVTHKVVAGETISSIAAQYGCTANEIKDWNNLRRNAVRTGQQLKIYTASASAVAQTQPQQPATPAATPAKPAKPVKPTKPVKENVTKTEQPQTAAVAATPKKRQNSKTEVVAEQPATRNKNKTAAAKREETKATAGKQGKKATAQAQEEPKANTKKNRKGNAAEQAEQASSKKKNNRKQQAEAPKKVEHEVKKGESLSKIAKMHGVTVDELRKANPKLKGDMLHPDDKLNVPSKAKASSSKNKKENKTEQPASSKKNSKKRK